MKTLIILSTLALWSSATLPAAEYLIVCSGQSNMAGVAKIAQLPEDLKPVPSNVVFFKRPDGGKTFEPSATFADGDKFGPTPSFVHALAKERPNDKFVILLDAVGGSSLSQWVTDYGPEGLKTRPGKNGAVVKLEIGKHYASLAERIIQLKKDYPDAKPLAFLWIQGESDKGPWAAGYLENFQRLAANVRRDLGNPELLIIAGEPGEAEEAVREAFRTFVKNDPKSALVPGIDLSHGHLHYDDKGYLELGRRFAKELATRMP